MILGDKHQVVTVACLVLVASLAVLVRAKSLPGQLQDSANRMVASTGSDLSEQQGENDDGGQTSTTATSTLSEVQTTTGELGSGIDPAISEEERQVNQEDTQAGSDHNVAPRIVLPVSSDNVEEPFLSDHVTSDEELLAVIARLARLEQNDNQSQQSQVEPISQQSSQVQQVEQRVSSMVQSSEHVPEDEQTQRQQQRQARQARLEREERERELERAERQLLIQLRNQELDRQERLREQERELRRRERQQQEAADRQRHQLAQVRDEMRDRRLASRLADSETDQQPFWRRALFSNSQNGAETPTWNDGTAVIATNSGSGECNCPICRVRARLNRAHSPAWGTSSSYGYGDFVRDESLDQVIDRIVQQEEAERQRKLELDYQRRGPRQLDLALTKLDPSSLSTIKDAPADCCICLTSIGDSTPVKLTNCGHIIHEDCLDGWSQAQDRSNMKALCPVCRTPYEKTKTADRANKG